MSDTSSSEDEEELKRLQAVSVSGQDVAAAAEAPSHAKVPYQSLMCAMLTTCAVHRKVLSCSRFCVSSSQRKRVAGRTQDGGTEGGGIVEEKVGHHATDGSNQTLCTFSGCCKHGSCAFSERNMPAARCLRWQFTSAARRLPCPLPCSCGRRWPSGWTATWSARWPRRPMRPMLALHIRTAPACWRRQMTPSACSGACLDCF